ncbi:MAG: Asp-tRNA(Asn)/Glu-tRNA(Gln) amidotransferase subunit GatC [Vicinamibacterales bacterium]
MPPLLTRDDVARIAALARLRLTDEEIGLFAAQLSEILAFAEEVQAVDTAGVPPFSGAATASSSTVRGDDPEPSLARDRVMQQAPDAAGGFFKVPRVVGS